MTTLLLICAVLAFIPVGQFLVNLFCYRPLPLPKGGPAGPSCQAGGAALPRSPDFPSPQGESPAVSVLIPARNESASIEAAVRSALIDPNPHLEVVVLDDHSSDDTADIVQRIAVEDPRAVLHHAPPLPAGWCGKQHACHVLSRLARHEWFLFMDADVRLAPGSVDRMVDFANRQKADLISGVPRQLTGTFSERLLIPLIHFVLLGYLPMLLMRLSRAPAFAAGCGQLFLTRRRAYRLSGGHAGIHSSLHDGLSLPALFRVAGFRTDLFDATQEAVCRMYRSNAEVWAGLGKNATEGLGHPARILPMTLLLIGGQVLPWFLLPWSWQAGDAWWRFSLLVVALPLSIRLIAARRFRQSLLGALLHPLGVAALIWIQWCALFRQWRGQPQSWRGRIYPPVVTTSKAGLIAPSPIAPCDPPRL
jgi:hypothetical protein